MPQELCPTRSGEGGGSSASRSLRLTKGAPSRTSHVVTRRAGRRSGCTCLSGLRLCLGVQSGCGEGRGSPGGAGGLCGGGREARALRGKGDPYGVRVGKPWDLESLGSVAGTL